MALNDDTLQPAERMYLETCTGNNNDIEFV